MEIPAEFQTAVLPIQEETPQFRDYVIQITVQAQEFQALHHKQIPMC